MEIFSEVNPLHKVQVRAGHKNFETTYSNYFHLPEDCLRFWINKAVSKLKISYKSTAAWTGVAEANLRQRIHCKKANGWTLMDEICLASIGHLPAGHEPTKSMQAAGQITPKIHKIDLHKHAKVLTDVFDGFDSEPIRLRNGLTEKQADAWFDAVGSLHSKLKFADVNRPPSEQLSSLESAVNTVNCLKLNYQRLTRPEWLHALKTASLISVQALTEYASCWLQCVKQGSLIFEDPTNAKKLLELFRLLGFSSNRFVIRVDRPKDATLEDALKLADPCRRTFLSIYGTAPQVEAVRHRRGRESVYFQLLTAPITEGTFAASALNDTQTVNALMLCIFAHIQMFEGANRG
jgi:hypothetical protein